MLVATLFMAFNPPIKIIASIMFCAEKNTSVKLLRPTLGAINMFLKKPVDLEIMVKMKIIDVLLIRFCI